MGPLPRDETDRTKTRLQNATPTHFGPTRPHLLVTGPGRDPVPPTSERSRNRRDKVVPGRPLVVGPRGPRVHTPLHLVPRRGPRPPPPPGPATVDTVPVTRVGRESAVLPETESRPSLTHGGETRDASSGSGSGRCRTRRGWVRTGTEPLGMYPTTHRTGPSRTTKTSGWDLELRLGTGVDPHAST